MWDLNDDIATPPLPSALDPTPHKGGRVGKGAMPPPAGPVQPPAGSVQPPAGPRAAPLDHGSWLLQVVPFFSDDYDPRLAVQPLAFRGWTLRYLGPLRVEGCIADESDPHAKPGRLRASGDLYVVRNHWAQAGSRTAPMLPFSSGQLPVFPLQDYSYYFTVQKISGSVDDQITLELAIFKFDAQQVNFGAAENLTAVLSRPSLEAIPQDWRTSGQTYLRGEVVNDRQTTVATIEMAWLSYYLREATIGIIVAPGLTAPLDNGQGDSVCSVFNQIGWKINIKDPVEDTVTAEVWQQQDLHAAMLALRGSANLDQEWLYDALVVPRFNGGEDVGFGRIFDRGLDSDLVPREGLN
jgi:hypothetical protein